jgi:hypothetical protein
VEGTWKGGINFHYKSIPYLNFTGPENQKRLAGPKFNVSQVGRLFMDKFVSADTDQSPQDPPGSGTKQDRIYRFP